MCEEVSPKTRVAEATHIEEGDAQGVYLGCVWAPFLCFLSLSCVVGFFSVAMECVQEVVPCRV